jgi:peptide/nickel transport system substrate-binding protein
MRFLFRTAVGCILCTAPVTIPAHAQTKGGELRFVVASKVPSYDGHTETTFGMIHPIRPFYSLLIRVNPDNPGDPTDIVCDLCEGDVPDPTDAGTTYTFQIRRDVKFHDGTPLTAHDIVASFNKIVSPPKGIRSVRRAFFKMIKSIEATEKYTVKFKLIHPSTTFIPAIAMPFNFIYAKKDLDQHGYQWHQRNINGTGAFTFVEHQTGAFVRGKRFDGYHFEGKPYLDGFRAITAPKLASRVLAIESDRAAIEFRGFPPKSRDNLVKALGDRVTVQQTDWNCSLLLIPNQKRKPFDDPRVRRALNLALDRWGGSKYLARIAIVKTVGGIVYPKHPLAATKGELEAMEGYWPDIHRSREMAKKLLKDAGQENLEFTLSNRSVDQPYKLVGTWAIDQWRRIGVHAKQDVVPTGVWLNRLFKGNFDMSTGANCQSVVNPISDVSTFLCSADNNFAGCKDQTLEGLYATLVRTRDAPEQRRLIREFERRVISEQAQMLKTLWWQRIAIHRSYVKGWKISPSHYLNQHLDQVWLDR